MGALKALTADGLFIGQSKEFFEYLRDAFDVHYAVPQGASGTLSVYVNGTKLSQELSLTSAYSYITTSNITGAPLAMPLTKSWSEPLVKSTPEELVPTSTE